MSYIHAALGGDVLRCIHVSAIPPTVVVFQPPVWCGLLQSQTESFEHDICNQHIA